ncbi:MAG: hypothetical protein R6U63_10250 [Longimicrobiales bacterium]
MRVERGRFPTNPAMVGREGTVVEHTQYFPHKITVSLDGDPELHTFAPDEVELVSAPAALPKDKADAKKRLARP